MIGNSSADRAQKQNTIIINEYSGIFTITTSKIL